MNGPGTRHLRLYWCDAQKHEQQRKARKERGQVLVGQEGSMGMYNGRAMLPPPPSPSMVLWQWQCCEVVDKRIGQQWWRTSFGADGNTLATGMVVCCCRSVSWLVVPVVVGMVRMFLDGKGWGKGSTRRLSTDGNALATGMAAFCCKTLLFWRGLHTLHAASHGPVLGHARYPRVKWGQPITTLCIPFKWKLFQIVAYT